MDRKTMTKLIAALVMCAVVVVMLISGLFVVNPVFAVKNNQVSGMIFWGTSGVARMYDDMNDESYNSSSSRTGAQEVQQHAWSSHTIYDFFNLGQFVNYTVSDASTIGGINRDGSGAVVPGTRDKLTSVIPYLDVVGTPKTDTDDNPLHGWADKDPVTEKPKKTAMVVWAGEDWIVRNRDSSDIGLSSAAALQDVWMGLEVEKTADTDDVTADYFDHTFNPGPGVDIKKDGGVLPDDASGSHHGAAGEQIKDASTETNVTVSPVLEGSSEWTGTHDYVFENSHMVSDDNLNHFSYNKADDGIDITLEHVMTDISDAFPSDYDVESGQYATLGQQAGTCFGRILSGYSYNVEFLEHDTESVPEGQETSTEILKDVWVGEYKKAHDDKSSLTYGPIISTSDSNYDGVSPFAEPSAPSSSTTAPDPDGGTAFPVDVYTWYEKLSTESKTVTDSYITWSGYHNYTLPNGSTSARFSVASGTYVQFYYNDNTLVYNGYLSAGHYFTVTKNGYYRTGYYGTHQEPVYRYRSVSYTITHVPAKYYWTKKDIEVNTRCDADQAPTPGYADSHHTHLYGGVDGMTDVTGSTTEDDSSARHYEKNGSNVKPGSDHRHTYKEHEEWYTDPDKPIMKVMTESREVKGYAGYWQEYYKKKYDGDLKVYVFGLGPYTKAQSDDLKDELWSDNGNLDVDTNHDGIMDRLSTNNIGTAHVSVEKSDWLVDTSIDGNATPGTIDEIKRTDRIDKSVTTFNTALKSSLSGAKFVDIYDVVLNHRPYYRYQNVTTAGGLHRDDAQHGKWYDKNTYNWIFHVMWSTILKDNPNPDPEEPIDISFYAASCALTSYANTALSPTGRQGSGTDSVHTALDILAAGTSGAGAAVGYGDEDYDFESNFITALSETSSMTDYKSLIGVENGTDGSAMYTYARYGRLLQDLGLDQTGLTSTISPRTVPGFLMELCYGANSSLSIVWDVSIDLLQLLNPFRFLVNQDTVDDVITDWNTTGGTNVGIVSEPFDDGTGNVTITEETVTPDTIDGIDEYDSSAGQIESGLSRISEITTMIYTRIRAMGLVLVIPLLLAFLVAGILLRNAFGNGGGMGHWPRIRVFLIRVVFIVVGIPMLGLLYTSMLDSISGITSVAASPSSQLVSATFVDFEGWVKTSRLNPPEDTILESDGLSNSYAGHASQDSIVELRKTAWLINDMTGRLNGVDMSTFTSGLTSNSAWNEQSLTRFDKDNWKDGLQSVKSVMGLLRDWSKGEFYYSSDFESETMALFSNTLSDHVGRHKGMYEDAEETGWDNANTLYQMFESVVAKDDWLSRSVDDNTAILTGTGDYAEGTSTDTDWHLFNIYANGTLIATPDTNVTEMTNVTYGSNPQVLTDGVLSGLSVRSHTGLSTLAMYNYLSTDFTPNALHIYSSARATNGHTSTAHYAVNLIGSGFTQWAFYLNCFALLFAVSIVGFFYSLRMTISVLKRGLTMLMTIPAAMVGVMKSIVQVIVTVISMILEILASILLYDVIAELLLSLSTVVEHYVDGQLTSVDATGVVGGLLGLIHRNLIGLQTNVVTYVFMLFVVSMIIFGFAFISVKYSYKFNCVFAKFVDFVFLQICENADQRAAYLKPQTQHERREKPLLDADVFVSCVHELVVGG